jgi:SAM-dependent methyltransferase
MPTPSTNFDRVARIYRWAEYLALGPLLQQTRTHFLPQLADRRRALVLGDGDGRFLARLLQQNPGLQAVAVDTSAAMLELLSKRCHAAKRNDVNRLRTWQGSALTVTPAKDTDLIVTHFFLDCLTQPEVDGLAHKLAAAVAPGALWLVSDFGPPRPRLLRPLAALYIRALYLAFRILTGLRVTHLPDPQAALAGAGFTRIARHERLCGLLYTELWQLAGTLAAPVKSSKAL